MLRAIEQPLPVSSFLHPRSPALCDDCIMQSLQTAITLAPLPPPPPAPYATHRLRSPHPFLLPRGKPPFHTFQSTAHPTLYSHPQNPPARGTRAPCIHCARPYP